MSVKTVSVPRCGWRAPGAWAGRLALTEAHVQEGKVLEGMGVSRSGRVTVQRSALRKDIRAVCE